MPKKIENARALLLKEAERLLEQDGYENLTMRSVANACGLGLGTAYNYFPSKNVLVASLVLEDWRLCLEKMKGSAHSDIERLAFVYACLQQFIDEHDGLFSDSKAKVSYHASAVSFHKPLREQLAQVIAPVCKGDAFTAQFIAESILRWVVEGVSFDALRPTFIKLI